MKILFISHSSELYGASKSMLYLIIDLKERYNIEPIVLTPDRGMLTNELDKLGIKYVVNKYYLCMTSNNYKFKIKKYIDILKYKYINKLFYLYAYFNLYNKKIDIVHTNTSVCDIGYYLSKKLNIPHIWHIREDAKNAFNLSYYYNDEIIKKQYKEAKYLVAVSNFVIKNQGIFSGLENIKVVYDGLKIDDVIKNSRFYNTDIVNICIIGNLSDNKNQLEAIEAINILVKRGICNIVLHIIGDGDFYYKERLNNYIKNEKLEKYVVFYGYSDEVYSILTNMHIGLMCSKNEAFGRVTVEYMFNCMPVIGSNKGGTKELIIDKKNGFLYELGNTQELANKIEYLIFDRDKMECMGKDGLFLAKEKFTLEKNTDNIYDIYKSIIK